MDLTTIQTALGLATTVIGATGQAATTVEKIKGLFSSDKAPENGEIQKLLNDLARDLTAANMMNMQLSEALKLVSTELRRQDEFETEKARYEKFQTEKNDIIYRLREDSRNGEPEHFVCPVCLNRDKLFSFIQGNGDIRFCQTDRNHRFIFKHTPQINRGRRRISSF